MASRTIQPLSPVANGPWALARLLGTLLTVGLLFGLIAWPSVTLHLMWDMVIPLLPAVFLVNPMIWRNVCPLATLNAATGQRMGKRQLAGMPLRISWALGIALLFLMVPARRFLFNENGAALAATIAAVAALALAAGMLFARRAGFCNSICPVLPVEKLYGQYPLVPMHSARCAACSLCTPSGCLDIAGEKTLAQTIGPARRTPNWLATPFGLFTVAFPGFIVGYFTSQNGSLSTVLAVYLHVLQWAAASIIVLGALVLLARITSRVALPLLGGLSFGLYYWFASPAIAEAYGGGGGAGLVLRLMLATLLAVWLIRAFTLSGGRAAGR